MNFGIMAGYDGIIPSFCLLDELAAMVREGVTPLAALQTAKLNPSISCRRTGQWRLESGPIWCCWPAIHWLTSRTLDGFGR